MQDLSYLATEGILTFDPNAYLNSPVTGNANPYAQIGLLPNGTKMKNQPTKDGFVSRNKETIKKVAAGAILTGLALFGIYKCKNATTKIADAFSGVSQKATTTTNGFIDTAKNYIQGGFDKVKNFLKK